MSLRDRLRQEFGAEPATRPITTSSMWPALRPGDSVRFARSSAAPRVGEIWVASRGELHLAHRVLWRRGGRYLLKGDWSLWSDGWLPRAAFFGPIGEIQRGGQWRATNRLRDRLAGLALSGAGSGWQALRSTARHLAGFALGEALASSLAAAVRRAAH